MNAPIPIDNSSIHHPGIQFRSLTFAQLSKRHGNRINRQKEMLAAMGSLPPNASAACNGTGPTRERLSAKIVKLLIFRCLARSVAVRQKTAVVRVDSGETGLRAQSA
jgi:hypothetical protein